MKKNVFRVVMILGISQVFFACGILPKEEEFPAAPIIQEYEGANYSKTRVIRGDIVQSENVSAEYHGAEIHELDHTESDSFNRRVQRVHVQKGSKVQKGDLLITYGYNALGSEGSETIDYDTAVYDINVTQAKLRHQRELLASEQKRLKALGAKKGEIRLMQEEYQASIRELESDLTIYELDKKEAEDVLKENNLISPVTGTVSYV
ncbi:MAG: HlyD family secretion protein, partial [Lachnoclostridium sp.]|nr:HlyD family secretion protein [Lachnoclostridium sp.]